MAFREAGNSEEGPGTHAPGFPIAWENIRRGRCARCGGELQAFEHLAALACLCGFQISTQGPAPVSAARGYRIGKPNFDSLTPF